MEKFEFIRPETPKKQIELCLESFDKKEAVKRICQWIEDTMDNVEMQIKNYENMHHVSDGILFELPKDYKLKYEYNLNQNVTIKPTDKGVQLMADRYNIEGMPKKWYTCFEAQKERLNDKGEVTMQMHEFMEYFGCLGRRLDEYVNLNMSLSES